MNRLIINFSDLLRYRLACFRNIRLSSMSVKLLSLSVACCFYSSGILAHGTSGSRLDNLEHQLAITPNDATLYLARGRLYQERHNMKAALMDYRQAVKIDPDLHAVKYWQGLLYLEQGGYDDAVKTLSQYVTLTDSSKGYAALAKVYWQQNAFRTSVDAWDKAIAKETNASPAMYHQRAQALMQTQALPYSKALLAEIVAGIEVGIVKQGPISSYLTLLVDVFSRNDQHQAALVTLARLPPDLLASPQWKVKKAEMLALIGNREEAIKAYEETLVTLDRLPVYKKNLTINQAIKQQAMAGLARSNAL
ncbi:tetratricopeptide repeat protein [Shewanella surugensis]|uniref:Tetratricopeptide repeat protein n=1 Tax=Shewanella surugensis TaxID=212020 RepID=A0ABT0LEW3_9GAMM|nr:tetratricopeptide repeat protein [Shewanella surugensis]MCL1126241.1 tetratricopeptide repeat protein [Shewanella surugensis]